jgi:hypothetical protein
MPDLDMVHAKPSADLKLRLEINEAIARLHAASRLAPAPDASSLGSMIFKLRAMLAALEPDPKTPSR